MTRPANAQQTTSKYMNWCTDQEKKKRLNAALDNVIIAYKNWSHEGHEDGGQPRKHGFVYRGQI